MKENSSGLKTVLPKGKLEARGCMEESRKCQASKFLIIQILLLKRIREKSCCTKHLRVDNKTIFIYHLSVDLFRDWENLELQRCARKNCKGAIWPCYGRKKKV